jgi:hypothetical protein
LGRATSPSRATSPGRLRDRLIQMDSGRDRGESFAVKRLDRRPSSPTRGELTGRASTLSSVRGGLGGGGSERPDSPARASIRRAQDMAAKRGSTLSRDRPSGTFTAHLFRATSHQQRHPTAPPTR